MMKLYCLAYGILITLLQAAAAGLSKLTDRVFWEIDHNDFLSGFMFALILLCLAWRTGLVRVL